MRYVKMDYIEYGKLWKLSRDNIKSAIIEKLTRFFWELQSSR